MVRRCACDARVKFGLAVERSSSWCCDVLNSLCADDRVSMQEGQSQDQEDEKEEVEEKEEVS